jgi:hypothetical protein
LYIALTFFPVPISGVHRHKIETTNNQNPKELRLIAILRDIIHPSESRKGDDIKETISKRFIISRFIISHD